MLGTPVGGEIGRRGEHRPAQSTDPASPQIRVWQVADANGKIELLGDEIDTLVGEDELEVDLRIPRQELAQDGRDKFGAEKARGADADGPGKPPVAGEQVLARGVDGRQCEADAAGEFEARGCGVQAPRRSRYELHAKIVLEPRKRTAHRLQRSAETRCRERQAAFVNDGEERRIIRKRGQRYSPEK